MIIFKLMVNAYGFFQVNLEDLLLRLDQQFFLPINYHINKFII